MNLLNVLKINTYIKEINIFNKNDFFEKIKNYSIKENIIIQCFNASMIYS